MTLYRYSVLKGTRIEEECGLIAANGYTDAMYNLMSVFSEEEESIKEIVLWAVVEDEYGVYPNLELAEPAE